MNADFEGICVCRVIVFEHTAISRNRSVSQRKSGMNDMP
jgi:hypothetical protein